MSSTQHLNLVASLSGHDERAWQVQWNPAYPIIASCAADKTVRLFNYTKSGPEYRFSSLHVILTGHKRSVRSIGWAPSGRSLATASFDSTIGIWEPVSESHGEHTMDQWECSSTVEGHENECKCVRYSASGTLLATCGRDKTVWLWEVQPDADFDCISVLMEHSQDVKCVAWHPTNEVLASASYDNTIKLYLDDPSDDWYAFTTLKGHSSTVWSIAFSPSGLYLASSSNDGTIIIWQQTNTDSTSGESLWSEGCRLLAHDGPIFSIAWAPVQHDCIGYLASVGADSSIKIWRVAVQEAASGLPTCSIWALMSDAHETEINSVDWCHTSGKDHLLATAGDDGLIKVWQLK